MRYKIKSSILKESIVKSVKLTGEEFEVTVAHLKKGESTSRLPGGCTCTVIEGRATAYVGADSNKGSVLRGGEQLLVPKIHSFSLKSEEGDAIIAITRTKARK